MNGRLPEPPIDPVLDACLGILATCTCVAVLVFAVRALLLQL